jgi:hypothetical protein
MVNLLVGNNPIYLFSPAGSRKARIGEKTSVVAQ